MLFAGKTRAGTGRTLRVVGNWKMLFEQETFTAMCSVVKFHGHLELEILKTRVLGNIFLRIDVFTLSEKYPTFL